MAVTVYVWPPHENQVGHAAVGVSGPDGECHISWWPGGEGKAADGGKAKSVYWGVPAERYSLQRDIEGEGNRQPTSVRLHGLDEKAIVKWWGDFANVHWSLLNTNCAQVAADALRAGGASDPVAWRDWTDTWNTVWTPMDVLRFAKAVEAGLRMKGG
jgi:hypothetical protein